MSIINNNIWLKAETAQEVQWRSGVWALSVTESGSSQLEKKSWCFSYFSDFCMCVHTTCCWNNKWFNTFILSLFLTMVTMLSCDCCLSVNYECSFRHYRISLSWSHWNAATCITASLSSEWEWFFALMLFGSNYCSTTVLNEQQTLPTRINSTTPLVVRLTVMWHSERPINYHEAEAADQVTFLFLSGNEKNDVGSQNNQNQMRISERRWETKM